MVRKEEDHQPRSLSEGLELEDPSLSGSEQLTRNPCGSKVAIAVAVGRTIARAIAIAGFSALFSRSAYRWI